MSINNTVKILQSSIFSKWVQTCFVGNVKVLCVAYPNFDINKYVQIIEVDFEDFEIWMILESMQIIFGTVL